MPGVFSNNKSEPVTTPAKSDDPGAAASQNFAPYYFRPPDLWSGLSMPSVVATARAADTQTTAVEKAREVTPAPEAVRTDPAPKDPSFFLGHNALGLKATVATGIVGAGYLYSMTSPASLLAGAIVWWGIERASEPFFNTKSTNPVNLGYYLLDKSVTGLAGLGRSALHTLSTHEKNSSLLETAVFGADALGLRTGLALTSYAVGWTGAFGIASPFLCGVAGAILYRGAEMAVRSWRGKDR